MLGRRDRGAGVARCGAVFRAQQPEGGPQLVECGPAVGGDAGKGGVGGLGVGAEQVLGDAGLGVDDGDVVSEDVVQLVGDADALGRDLAVGLGLPAVLGGLGPLFGGARSARAARGRGGRRTVGDSAQLR